MVELCAEILRLAAARTPCALCTVVRTSGSTPRKQAARMLVRPDGSLLGTIGGGRIEKEISDLAVALLATGDRAEAQLHRYHLTHQLGMCCGGEMEVFIEPLIPAPALVVCGGGHVGQALVPLARRVGFSPIVVEDLEDLAQPARFPEADRIIDSFDVRDWRDLALGTDTYVVIVTRDHRQDQALLEQLVDRDLAYLGLIGSQRKIALFQRRLEHKGFAPERLRRVHAPIGLDIGAETPEEIAVAIVAELIQVRAARRHPAQQATAAPAPRPPAGRPEDPGGEEPGADG